MKDLVVAVIVLSVALALVIGCFAAAALVVARKLHRLGATRDQQFLLRRDSAGVDRTLLGTSSTVEFEGRRGGSDEELGSGGQPGSDEAADHPGIASLVGGRGTALSRRGSGISASSWELKALGDYHQHLLKMRLEGGLEGIEMGPILGRGSFGRVYKGRWQGALVAIKIVEHSLKGAAAEIEGARESLLAASISHPNVVACYKICTVRLNLPESSPTDSDGDEQGAPAAQPPATRGSAKEEQRSSGVSALSPLDLQRKRSLERIRAERRAATASPPLAGLERLTSAERHEILAGSSAGSAPGPFALTSVLGSRRPSVLETVPSEESAPHVALDIREDTTAELDHRGKDVSEEVGHSESGGDAAMALELEVLQSEELAAGADEDQAVIETWMLLEYADRGSLEQAIASRRFTRKADQSLDMGSIYRTLMDIATGMHYLHCLAIVHGDLKPANVLLKSTVTDVRGFVCKLADFGLSRVLDLNVTHLSTQSFGTVPYMPPELLSQGRMTKAVDVYSFGMLMWHLFVGQQPFNGMQMGQVLYGVVHCCARPELPPDMPPAYSALIEGCWSADPDMRPAFQAIIEALHQQMQQHLAAEKAAAAAASAAAAKRVSPFGAMSNLMKMKSKSSSSDSEGTRTAAAAAAANRSLSVTSRDAADRQLSHPGGAADVVPAAVAENARQVPGGGSLVGQGPVAASPVKSGAPSTMPRPAGSMIAGATATISQSASPKSSASLGGRSTSEGSSGHFPAGLFRRSGSAAEAASSPSRLLQPVAAFAARLRRSFQGSSDAETTTGSLSEPSMQKLIQNTRGLSSFSHGSLPVGLLVKASQGERQSHIGSLATSAELPRQPPAPTGSPLRLPVAANRSGSAPAARLQGAVDSAARRAFSTPDSVVNIAAELAGPAESTPPMPWSGAAPTARAATQPIASAAQRAAQTIVRPSSPFATGLYAPPPPPSGTVSPVGAPQQPEQGSRSAVALAAEVVAANAVLAERARAKRAYAAVDRAQVNVDRAGKALTGMEAAAASFAASPGASRFTYDDQAATAAVNAAASAVRHDAAAGSALFFQQRYLESAPPQGNGGARPSSEVSRAIAAAAASVLGGPRYPEAGDQFTRLIRTGDEAGGPLRYSVEWRRSSGPEMLPIALRGGYLRAHRRSSDMRTAGSTGREPLKPFRSAGDEGPAQGLLVGATPVRSVPLRSRSSPESSHSGGSSDSGPAEGANPAPIGRSPAGTVSKQGGGSASDGNSSFMLAPSRLPDVPPGPMGPPMGPAHRGFDPVAAGAAHAELSGSVAVDQAEPPGMLPLMAVSQQHPQHAPQPHRQLPPLSPASSPQLHRNASSSTAASMDSRGSVRSSASMASTASARSGPVHVQRPPPVAASAGWAGIRGSLDVSGTDATVGEEKAQVSADGSMRSSPAPDGQPAAVQAAGQSQQSPSPSPAPAPVAELELAHPSEPPARVRGSAPQPQSFAEAADAAVAAVEASSEP